MQWVRWSPYAGGRSCTTAPCYCSEMSASGHTASHRTGPKLSLKENLCSSFYSGIAGGKARASRSNVIISLLLGQLQAGFVFPLLLTLQLQTPLTACIQESGKTRPISLSNQDFVLLQYRRSSLTRLQIFYSLYTLKSAPRWGFCNPYSLHAAYGPTSVMNVVG